MKAKPGGCLIVALVSIGVISQACLAAPTACTIASPDATIALTINLDSSQHLQYSVTCDGRPVLLPSYLGLIVDGQDLGAAASIGPKTYREIDERYPVFGAHSIAENRCREAVLSIRSGKNKLKWQLHCRVFDDGVAIRFRVPGSSPRHVDGESTTWRLPEGGMAWFHEHNNRKDYEASYQVSPLAALTDRKNHPAATTTADSADSSEHRTPLLATPVTVRLSDGRYVFLTEANLIDYSDMALESVDKDTLKANFHNDPAGWEWQNEIISPWRVTLVSRDLNGLVNSDLIRNLCPAPSTELADSTWIKPGRSTWHWMVTGRPTLAEQQKWVDWTNQLGFEYYIIDDGWNRWQSDDKKQDAWACLKEVVDYASSKDVKIWAWVDSKELRDAAARERFMSRARSIGVVGLKVDFMKPANVEWVNWYEDTLRDAAKHRLMLDFHGAVKPSGRERTWPHDLTREAIRGREGGKQSGLHDTSLPFTRFVQGPADYTPTDFRTEKLKGSSWAHELSMAIIFTSPLLCFGGSPENYLDNEAVEIIKAIPASWDETIVLPSSEIGSLAAFARRSGDKWFVAVLNGGEERALKIDMQFLGKGTFKLEEFADSREKPDAWTRSDRFVTDQEELTINLRQDGGYVATFTGSNP